MVVAPGPNLMFDVPPGQGYVGDHAVHPMNPQASWDRIDAFVRRNGHAAVLEWRHDETT